MTIKIFQVDRQNRWLSIEATSARGLVTRSLEPAVKVVALATILPMIPSGAVSLVTGPPTPIDKMISSITRHSILVAVRHL